MPAVCPVIAIFILNVLFTSKFLRLNIFMRLEYLNQQAKKYKAYHELPCDCLPSIQNEILEWLQKKTNFINDKTTDTFWMKVDFKDMAKTSPTLIKYMRSIRIPIREIVVGLLNEALSSGFVLHHGAPPLNFKINFPILNTEDVYTEWFDIPMDVMETLPLTTNVHTGTTAYDLKQLHNDVHKHFACVGRYNMHLQPVILNSFIPHRVMPGPDAKYPRIMIATMPIKDPVDLMQLA
jgi:hypothetical protein